MEYRVWCYGGENWWPSNFAARLGQKGSLPNTNKTKYRLHVQTWLANVLYWRQIMNTPLQLNFTVRTSWLTVEQNYSFIGTGPGSKGTERKKFTNKYDPTNFISYILSDSVWVNLSENMVHAFIQPIRKAKRLFHLRVERFDQSQRTHQKQPCFRQLCVFITAFILVALSKS